MTFIKNKSSWYKGKPLSKEVKEKLSFSKKGQTPWNKDIPMSVESKKKLSFHRKGIAPWNKGKSWSEEVKEKISKAQNRSFTTSISSKTTSLMVIFDWYRSLFSSVCLLVIFSSLYFHYYIICPHDNKKCDCNFPIPYKKIYPSGQTNNSLKDLHFLFHILLILSCTSERALLKPFTHSVGVTTLFSPTS